MLGYAEQNQQLTEARRTFDWLGSGSVTVQQQALRDFHHAISNWRAGTHRRPTWRKRGRHDGFRIVGAQAHRVEQLNRRWSQVLIPKVGWVRFRRTREMPEAKSYRVTPDNAGRWHLAFAAIPDQVCRAKRGSTRRTKVKARLARLHARNTDTRKDFIEKVSTAIVRTYDLIRIEDLRVAGMTRSAGGTVEAPGCNVRQKAGLNPSILAGGWSLFATRLEQKAPGRVSSQRCSACGHIARESRKSQALFLCVACGHKSNADLNAACNIAAGHAVTARGGSPWGGPVNRELQHAPSQVV